MPQYSYLHESTKLIASLAKSGFDPACSPLAFSSTIPRHLDAYGTRSRSWNQIPGSGWHVDPSAARPTQLLDLSQYRAPQKLDFVLHDVTRLDSEFPFGGPSCGVTVWGGCAAIPGQVSGICFLGRFDSERQTGKGILLSPTLYTFKSTILQVYW